MMNKKEYDFHARTHEFASKIINKIPAGWCVDPSPLLIACDKEGLGYYRLINNQRNYKFDILEKYKDRNLGHGLNSSGNDVFMVQINRYCHVQFLPSLHALDQTIFGLKSFLFTKGGNDFEDFVNNNIELEQNTNERSVGFGG